MDCGARLFQLGIFVLAMLLGQALWIESATGAAVESGLGNWMRCRKGWKH